MMELEVRAKWKLMVQGILRVINWFQLLLRRGKVEDLKKGININQLGNRSWLCGKAWLPRDNDNDGVEIFSCKS